VFGPNFAAGQAGLNKVPHVKKAISDALAVQEPAIVDTAVVANELPTCHTSTSGCSAVAFAKIREAVLAVTGS
jgi:hypothetical protein